MEARREGTARNVADLPPVVLSPWSPFRQTTFTVLWTATVIANIGTWMYNAASGWLMTSLNADPLMVSLVQVATSLPMFLFAVPAGALADIVDKRRFLIVIVVATTGVSAMIAALVWLNLVTPGALLLFTFLLGAGAALTAPAWQSIVPQLVPKQTLSPAIAANSVGINISRALGPALGGVIIAGVGIAAPFWLNAVSNLAIIGALLWWHSPPMATNQLPAERFRQRNCHWISPCETQSEFAGDINPSRGVLFVCQRLLGAASPGGAQPDLWRTGALWHSAGRDRGRGSVRRFCPAMDESEVRT